MKMPNTRAKVTAEKYAEILTAYRGQQTEGQEVNHNAVSALTGVPVRTCNKAYNQGWPNRRGFPENGRPIREVLTGEGMLARAAIAREDQGEAVDRREVIKEQLKAAQMASTADLIKSRADQGKTVRATRQNARGLLFLSGSMLAEGKTLVDSVRADVVRLLSENKLDLAAKMRILGQIASFAKTSVEVARMTEQIESLALGDPKAILDMMDDEDGSDLSTQECLAILAQSSEALERSKESGIIVDAEFTDITVERKLED